MRVLMQKAYQIKSGSQNKENENEKRDLKRTEFWSLAGGHTTITWTHEMIAAHVT